MAAATVSNPVTVTVASLSTDQRALLAVAGNLRAVARHLERPVGEDERERLRRLLKKDAELLDDVVGDRK